MNTLHRRITPAMLLMLSINGTVGSAWLFAPLYAAKIAGPGAMVAWVIGGLATACVALTFAELSAMFPVAGGTAEIPRLSHGVFASFVMTWLAWLSALTMAPIEVQAILQYASTYFHSLVYLKDGIPVLTGIGYVWATILMLSFCMINIVSYKGLARWNFALFTFKVGVILLVIGALIHSNFHPANFFAIEQDATSSAGLQAILTAVATGGVAFAFTGFKHGVELAGETKRLGLAMPLAIVGSVIVCLALYLGLQVAFLGAIDPYMLQHGWSHLSFAGDVGPFAGLAAGLGLAWLVKILYIDAAASPAGAGLVYVASTGRILYAMAKIGYLPRWLTQLNKEHFPVAAIAVNFVIGMLLFLPLTGWQAMVSFLVSGMVISYGMGPIALLCLREELPNKSRPFKLPFAKSICLLAFYFCNLLCYWTGWETISKLSIAMVIGVLCFCIAILRGSLKMENLGSRSAYWIAPYLLGLVTISYLGAFGGQHVIPFGWDFAVIGVFSTVILYVAVKNRARVTNVQLEAHLAEAPIY